MKKLEPYIKHTLPLHYLSIILGVTLLHLKDEVINNTTEYNHYGIPHNIFPLKSREMIVLVLVNLSA